jgi:PAS domain S-box-containing protein
MDVGLDSRFDGAFFKTALERVGDGILMVDQVGGILWSNNRAAEIFGVESPSLTDFQLADFLPKTEHNAHRQYLAAATQDDTLSIYGKGRPVAGRTLNGRPLDLNLNITRVASEEGTVFLAVVRDISHELEYQRSLHHRSTFDFITQLLNREGFVREATVRFDAIKEEAAEPLWLGLLNVSGIGKINHWIGFEAGDLALHEIGFRLHYLSGDQALLGRVDGNEFAILQPASRAPKSAEDLAATAEALGYEIDVGGRSIDVRFACGGAFSADGPPGEDFMGLVGRTRTALHEARINERDHMAVFYDQALDQRERIARRLEDELVHALARDEFFIQVQPKVAMNRHISGFEALLRWRTPDGELVPPGVFIPIAEANGTIRTIGVWVFQEVCRLAARENFKERGLRISVNLSPRQMESGTLPDMLAKICADTGADPETIELEVTESWAVEDYERGSGMLEKLKQKGFGISLDDFGTGYSSLSALVQLPVDIIKIDRSLLPVDVADNPDARKLLNATIDLCRAMGREVLVEGVETEEQYALLAEHGCDLAQGYLFGRPCAYEDVMNAPGPGQPPLILLDPEPELALSARSA